MFRKFRIKFEKVYVILDPRVPLPNKEKCADLMSVSCLDCAKYYDGRDLYAYKDEGKCVYVPDAVGNKKCKTKDWATDKGKEFDEECPGLFFSTFSE